LKINKMKLLIGLLILVVIFLSVSAGTVAEVTIITKSAHPPLSGSNQMTITIIGLKQGEEAVLRIGTETARFGQLEVDVHLSPGIVRLWRLVGLSRAKYLGMTCEIIDAQEAYRIGLADKVVKVDQLMTEARKLAARFVAKPRESLEKTKQSYINVIDMDHKGAVNYETLLLCHLFDSDERRQIMDRFLKRR